MYVYATCIQTPLEVQRGHQIPLVLKLQAFMSHLPWVLGLRLESATRAATALQHGAISPAPHFFVFEVGSCVAQAGVKLELLMCPKLALNSPFSSSHLPRVGVHRHAALPGPSSLQRVLKAASFEIPCVCWD